MARPGPCSPLVVVVIAQLLSPTVSYANIKDCTAGGSPCQLPYLHQGRLTFSCTTEAPSTAGGGQDLFGRCPVTLADQVTREPGTWARCDPSCPLQRYTPNDDIVRHMVSLAARHPGLASLVTVGASSLGQNITGVRISRGLNSGPREILKPMVRYSGNMHGNEPVGREMINHLAEVLLEGYGLDPEITDLLDTTDITLIPTINPDGFDRGEEGACSGADYRTGRFNEGNVDLNRNFPTWADINKTRSELFSGREPETQAMMNLILSFPWVLSANFHDGAVVASYPYDDYQGRTVQTGVSATPDHDMFRHLASTYATKHQTMLDQSVCTRWYFYDGITNGADWYPLYGGMQDFNYIFTNDMEITLELSCCKYPRRYYLNKEWERNRGSMLGYLQQVHRGVKGLVTTWLLDTAQAGQQQPASIAGAVVVVRDTNGTMIEKNVTTSEQGEYWRLLLPGLYTVQALYNLCSTAGLVLVSGELRAEVTEQRPLLRLDLDLDTVTSECDPSGPR